MEGWIKLYRKFTDWEWYTDNTTKCLFIHLLLSVNHQPKKWRGLTINEGETITSIGSLAAETGLTSQQVRTALKKLESTGEIIRRATNKNTLLIVVNYGLYQGMNYSEQQTDNTQDNKQITNKQQSNNKQITTNKNEKNIKNEKNVRNNKAFARPSVSDVETYCKENRLNVNAQQFVDYYDSNGWKVGKNAMKDWKATCRNWARRENANKNDGKLKRKPSFDIDEIAKKAKLNDNYDID